MRQPTYRVRVTWVLADDPRQAAGLGLDEVYEMTAPDAWDAWRAAEDAAEYRGACGGVDPDRFRTVVEVTQVIDGAAPLPPHMDGPVRRL